MIYQIIIHLLINLIFFLFLLLLFLPHNITYLIYHIILNLSMINLLHHIIFIFMINLLFLHQNTKHQIIFLISIYFHHYLDLLYLKIYFILFNYQNKKMVHNYYLSIKFITINHYHLINFLIYLKFKLNQ